MRYRKRFFFFKSLGTIIKEKMYQTTFFFFSKTASMTPLLFTDSYRTDVLEINSFIWFLFNFGDGLVMKFERCSWTDYYHVTNDKVSYYLFLID